MKNNLFLILILIAFPMALAQGMEKQMDLDSLEEPNVFFEALENKKKMALEGNFQAQYQLAKIYSQGKGVPRDKAQAERWYILAAKSGEPNLQYELGSLYYSGEGLPLSYKKAVKWIRKAAKSGHAEAETHMGNLFMEGDGVKKDYKKALYWYTRAAKKDYVWAQHFLGVLYFSGEGGVPKNYIRSYAWLLLAKQSNKSLRSIAESQLENLVQVMTPSQIALGGMESKTLSREIAELKTYKQPLRGIASEGASKDHLKKRKK